MLTLKMVHGSIKNNSLIGSLHFGAIPIPQCYNSIFEGILAFAQILPNTLNVIQPNIWPLYYIPLEAKPELKYGNF